MSKIAIRIIWLAATFAVISSCGIPTTQFLGAPEAVSSTVTPPTVTFAHNVTDNGTDPDKDIENEDFLGYELYYKFYQWMPNPVDGQFGADLSIINAASAGTGTVTGQGFRRVWEADKTILQPPLISIDRSESGDPFDVVLIFPDKPSASSPEPAEAVFLSRSVQLARDPYAGAVRVERTFESDDISTDPPDPDIPASIPPTDPNIHMAIVILAYGADKTGGTFGPLYSKPVMVDQPLEIILH